MTAAEGSAPQSVIHDIGFRHYDGPRLGRRWAFRSLLLETLRGAYGLGRPARTKIMPWTLLGLFTAPALIMVTVVILIHQDSLPLSYTQYPVAISLLVSLFVAGRAPYAVSRDIRDGVIPLYLSRPIARRDYVAAKFAGLWIAVFAFIAAPITVLMVGALLAKLSATHALWGWLGGLLMAAMSSALITAVSLAIASFTKRRGLGVAAILATLVLSSGFANVVVAVVREQVSSTAGSYGGLLDPFLLVDGLTAAWLGVEPQNGTVDPAGAVGTLVFTAAFIGVIWVALAILFRRFRKVGGV